MDRTGTWNRHRRPAPVCAALRAFLALLALCPLSCGAPPKTPGAPAAPGEWRTFEGTGTSSGRVQILRLGPGRVVSILSLTGSLVLTGERGLGEGFRTETIGYSDNVMGGKGWCVWTDSRGDQVFSEVRGGPVGVAGNRIAGKLLGGTGRYAGGSGDYEFEWQYVVHAEDGTIYGRVAGFRGRVRQDAVPAATKGPAGPRGEDGTGHGVR